MRNFLKNSIIVLFSFFLICLVIEASLRMAGRAYLLVQHWPQIKIFTNSKSNNSQEIRILCLGESTTAIGLGDSYPQKLQKLLNEKYPMKKFVVINEGVSGTDTSKIWESLPVKIEKYQPQIVITMIGINDHWNLIVNNQPQKRINNQDHYWEIFFKKFSKISKIGKLIYLTKVNWENKDETQKNYQQELKNIENMRLKKSQLEKLLVSGKQKEKEFAYLQLGQLYWENKRYSEARDMYLKVLENNPKIQNDELFLTLGMTYLNLGEIKMAISTFDKYLSLPPISPKALKIGLNIFYDNRQLNQELSHKYLKLAFEQTDNEKIKIQAASPLLEMFYYTDKWDTFLQAKKYYQYLSLHDPKNVLSYLHFSSAALFEKKYDEAIGALELGIKNAHDDNPVVHFQSIPDLWLRLTSTHVYIGEMAKAKTIFDKATKLFPDNQGLKLAWNMDYFKTQIVRSPLAENNNSIDPYQQPITKKNYLSIVNYLKSKHIIPVAMQYPNRRADGLKQILNGIEDVVLVDNFSNFKNALETHPFGDLFVDNFGGNTGHFTPYGSGILAENIELVLHRNLLTKNFFYP